VAVCVVFFILRKHAGPLPDVIFISIDALRTDHLGCNGYVRNTTPNIDKLARQGINFINCFATSSGTVYSFPSILTGRYLEIEPGHELKENILNNNFTTLAEYLRKWGYYTAAFLINVQLKEGKGFEQGFDYYFLGHWESKGLTNVVLDFLKDYRSKNKIKKPLFLWVYYIDPHAPYTPPEEYSKIFENDELYIKNDKMLTSKPDAGTNSYLSQGNIPQYAFIKDKYSLSFYVACYDGEIFNVDLQIGRLLRKIKDNSLIVLSADHGESLGEHNEYFVHSTGSLFDELLHVPLIIKDNRNFKGGKTISAMVSSVDIVPTILHRINPVWYFFNNNEFDGISLKTILKGKPQKRRYLYSYLPWAKSIRDIQNNIKYISDTKKGESLYFLPDEINNRINENSFWISNFRESLKKELKNWSQIFPIKADSDARPLSSFDERTKLLLRKMGYMQ
jgi:arylsulfatase A-like enzyme